MPSQLEKNAGIYFLCARNFLYKGHEYKIGDTFPDYEANNVEILVRTRRVIPVVDDYADKPRHWYREVQLASNVKRKLGLAREEGRESIRHTELFSAFRAGTDGTATDVYDPSDYKINEVLTFAEQHPDMIGELIESESNKKNRSTLLAKLEEMQPYEPDEHTVAEVKEYVEEHPEEAQEILEAEQDGKERTTLLPALEDAAEESEDNE
jgi:hypothetical protein